MKKQKCTFNDEDPSLTHFPDLTRPLLQSAMIGGHHERYIVIGNSQMVAKRGDPPYKHGLGPTMRPMVGGGARDARGPRAVWRTLAPTPWPHIVGFLLVNDLPAFDIGSKALADWCILQKRMVQGECNEMCIDGHKVCQTLPIVHKRPTVLMLRAIFVVGCLIINAQYTWTL